MSDTGSNATQAAATDMDDLREAEVKEIREALQGLQFGTVTIIVQDGVVVQIDRTEKRRLRRRKTQPKKAHPTIDK